MGAGQSQPVEVKTVYVNEQDIPAAYKTVGVSDEVVNAVNQNTGASRGPSKVVIEARTDPQLSSELERQRDENRRLKEEMLRLSQLQSRQSAQNPTDSRQDIEEKKKVFDEAVTRVKQQFFGYQRENVCSDIEKQLTRCLNQNKTTLLNCQSLTIDYDKCVNDFRARVLKDAAVKQ